MEILLALVGGLVAGWFLRGIKEGRKASGGLGGANKTPPDAHH